MIEFIKYYRINAVVKKAQLYSPPVVSLPDAGLPFSTALHYTPRTAGVVGLNQSSPVVRGLKRSNTVVTAFGPVDSKLVPGPFVAHSVRPNEIISKFMRTVPGWKRADLEPSYMKNKENVVIWNYGLYEATITSQTNTLQNLNSFKGYWNNLLLNVKNQVNPPLEKNGKPKFNPRNQFLIIETPDIVPDLKTLNNYLKDPTNAAYSKSLGSDSRLVLAELWNWLAGAESVFSIFTDRDLRSINLMFTRASSAAIVNMYLLKHMVKDATVVKAKDRPAPLIPGQDMAILPTISVQKALLMLLTSFKTKVDSGIVSEVLTEEELDGYGQAEADEENYNDLQESILNDEDPDAPSEKDITQQFIADTTEAGLDMSSVLKNKQRSKVAENLAAAKKPEDELEEIFNEDNSIDDESEQDRIIEETMKILEELNEGESESVNDDNEVNPEPEYIETYDPETGVETAFANVNYKPYKKQSQVPEECFMRLVMAEAEKGNLTAAEVRRFEAISKKYRTSIKDPHGGEGTLAEAAKINPEDLKIPEHNKLAKSIPGVFDESFLESSHDRMHQHYNKNILKKDILANSIQLMKAGYAIDNYEIHTHNDIVDSYEIHTVRLVPIRGKPSTIKFRVPIVTPNGTFKAGGNTNRMRVQRADIPIRKVSPGEVALTSYHSKMWIRRSPLVAFNFDKFIEKTITAAATNPDKLLITNVSYGNCFNPDITAPLTYTAISRYFTSFTIGKYSFMWDAKKNDQFFGAEVNKIAQQYSDEQVMCGKGENSIIWMDKGGNLYEAPMRGRDNAIAIGTITSLIGVDPYKIPVQSADLKIFSKAIPIGIALSFWIGLGNLLKTINAKFRRVPARSPLNLQPHEFYVKFRDETLVFDRNDEETALIMAGWNEYHAFIKFYSVYDFDKKDTFGRFFFETKIEGRYENELTIIRELWIDPITEGELIRLKEPTDMVNLFLSGVNKLTYDKHPDPMDGLFQRDRGYERISGFVYDNMVRSVRGHRNRRFMKDAAIDMPPDVVWYDILKDQTTGISEFSNPIHSLKEQEVVVFRGAGGRSSQSMMASNRKAHRSNVGRDSEATVDSGDVATVIYTTANPNYDSVRGTVRYTEKPNENISRSFGTSQLLAPAAEYDDPNRRNFISIQNSRTTNSAGSTPLPVRTGYERVLPYRQNDIYATVARQGGKVTAKTNKVIVVEYEDGSKQEIEIGLRYGEWSGKTMPHDVITDLKVGESFTEGTPIAWGKNFFTKDLLTGGLIYKPGVLARVVLVDDEDTWEDSSAITANFAKKLVTQRVDKRDIVVESAQEIRNLLTVGTDVDMESILCTIFNPSEGNKDIFSQDSLDSLKDFTSNSPQAKANGVITDIEVYYTGQIEDMSDTLQDIVEASNARLYKLNKALKKPALDGRVDVGTRFSGTVMNMDMVLIRIRILTQEDMDIGSKLVFCHQMKSVVGRKIVDRLETESGEPIDAKFSNTSFSNRIVDSGNQIGTTSLLCVAATKAFVAAYRGKKI